MKRITNTENLAWEKSDGPDDFSAERKSLTAVSDPCGLGCSLFRLSPGIRSFPAHSHFANDEAVLILEGEATLIFDNEEYALKKGDYFTLPAGTGKAHQIMNHTDEAVQYLCFSTMNTPDIVLYPTSNKVGIIAGRAPGGPEGEGTITEFIPRAPVDYWHGEES